MRDWCKGRSWLIRLPVWLYLAYVGVEQFRDPQNYYSWFAGINLAIHEGGHILFRPSAISFTSRAAPLRNWARPPSRCRDYFGITFCFGWLSTNLIGVGVYMADARARDLPLVSAEGGGEGIIHDWNWLFGQLGLLNDDQTIGLLTRGLGSASMLVALSAGAWIMWEMHRAGGAGKRERK